MIRFIVEGDSARAIKYWLESQNKRPEDVIRNYNSCGGPDFYFRAGYNYDFIDADLLGGNASGMTRKQFERETGHSFYVE